MLGTPLLRPPLLPDLPEAARGRRSSRLTVLLGAGRVRPVPLLRDVGDGADAAIQDVSQGWVLWRARGGGAALAAAQVRLLAVAASGTVGEGRGPGGPPVTLNAGLELIHVHARVQTGVVAARWALVALQLDDGVPHPGGWLPLQGDEPGSGGRGRGLAPGQLQQGALGDALQLARCSTGTAKRPHSRCCLTESPGNRDRGLQEVVVVVAPPYAGALALGRSLQRLRLVLARLSRVLCRLGVVMGAFGEG